MARAPPQWSGLLSGSMTGAFAKKNWVMSDRTGGASLVRRLLLLPAGPKLVRLHTCSTSLVMSLPQIMRGDCSRGTDCPSLGSCGEDSKHHVVREAALGGLDQVVQTGQACMGHCKGYHTLTPVTAAAGLHGPQKGNHRPRLEGSYRPPRPGEVRCRSRGAPSWGSICKACLIYAAAKAWCGLARHAGRDQHHGQGCTTACAPVPSTGCMCWMFCVGGGTCCSKPPTAQDVLYCCESARPNVACNAGHRYMPSCSICRVDCMEAGPTWLV